MRALYLRQVNLLAGHIGEEQSDECIAEDGGDFGNGAVEGGVAVAHERSPWKTTHDDPTISAWRSTRRLVDVIDAALCRVR
jgi:hypothetical protein